MTFNEFRSFVEGKMETDWTVTPIEFQNVSESAALIAAKDAKTPWIRLTIVNGDGSQITIGSPSKCDRYAGNIIVQIFTGQKIGTKTGLVLADSVSVIWNGFTGEADVEIRTPSMNVIGELQGWFQINVTIPFLNDEIS